MSKKINIILIIIWMIIIFSFSAMPGSSSVGTSKKILETILTETHIVKEEATNNEFLFNIIHYCFRKTLHFSEYLILSVLIMNYLRLNKFKIINMFLISSGISFIYSLTDEIHQMFTANRTPLFKDCLLDTSGAVIGSLIFVLVLIIKKQKKSLFF